MAKGYKTKEYSFKLKQLKGESLADYLDKIERNFSRRGVVLTNKELKQIETAINLDRLTYKEQGSELIDWTFSPIGARRLALITIAKTFTTN